MIKNILVPMDGSNHAKKAFDYACDLAAKYGAKVHLMHVISKDEIPEGLDKYMEVERIEEPREQVLKKIGDEIIKAGLTEAKAKGVEDVKSSVVMGDPAEKIIEFAKQNGVDMIIMGSRGLGAMKGILLGSVSSKVCHVAECTCVTVK
jgi:nucleotide-binding universal stress UspA family protein